MSHERFLHPHPSTTMTMTIYYLLSCRRLETYYDTKDSIMDEEDDDEYLQAQQASLAEYGRKQQARRQRLEDEALARALADSEAHARQQHQELETMTENLARSIYEQELQVADQELATALETSEQEFTQQASNQALEDQVLSRKRARAEERNDGSWDCVDCTYENPPYSPECFMCQTKAPPTVLTFLPFSNSRFGVELEIVISNGHADGYTLERIAKDLTQLGTTVEYMEYTHITVNHWKIVTDASVRGTPNDLGFELVSPVLQGDAGLDSIRTILQNVRKLGIETNASCGFHVHVDATNGDLQAVRAMGTVAGLRRVARAFVALENAFDLVIASSQGRRANQNEFCGSNRLAMGSLSNRQRWERISIATNRTDLVGLLNPDNDRYKKLNLTNLTKPSRPSTIEFRHHGGVSELLETEAWVRLVLRFCDVVSQSEDARCLLPEDSTPKEELRVFFEILDCHGLEQFYTTERRLFQEDRLHNQWECTCGRQFRDSRALSQHTSTTGHSS